MENTKLQILQIMYKLSKGEIKYNLASKQVLELFADDKYIKLQNLILENMSNEE